MDKVFIGLGSNLKDPLRQLTDAISNLKKIKNSQLLKVSSFYKSTPMGPQDQPDYINAVAELKTELSAEQLLDELQNIENNQGRLRLERWGARTLDLDILLYGQEIINSERLIVPHNGISQRDFVLQPLNDLVEDDFEIPTMGTIKKLLKACPTKGLQRI